MSADEPTERWDFYFTSIREHLASIAVDLALAERAPDPERPWLVLLRVPLLAPRADGLSGAEEAAALAALEEALARELAAALGARQVGRLTTGGRRELFYYAKSTVELETSLAAIGEGATHRLLSTSRRDPRWEVYLELLLPGPEEQRWMLDRRAVEALQDQGDLGREARPVEHTLALAGAEAATAAAAQLRAEGFEVRVVGEAPVGRWTVRAARVDAVELDHIHAVSLLVAGIAEAAGGEYEGWGAPVVRGPVGQG